MLKRFPQFSFLVIPEFPSVVLDVPERVRGQIASGVDNDVDVVEMCVIFEDNAAAGEEFGDLGLPGYAVGWSVAIPARGGAARLVDGEVRAGEEVEGCVVAGGGVANYEDAFVGVEAGGAIGL